MLNKGTSFVLSILFLYTCYGFCETEASKPHPHTRTSSSRQAATPVVEYTLYTKQNKQGKPLSINDAVLQSSGFDFKKVTKFVTHGWTHNNSNISYLTIRDAYLKYHDYNVITVNWTRLSGPVNDSVAVTNSQAVGENFGNFLNYLLSKNADAKLFHLIGHGVGAHVSGYAANKVIIQYNVKVNRVTGLDPTIQYKRRLSDNDGIFVDVIHTSGGIYGILDAFVMADYYPNGGIVPQPGCSGFYEEFVSCAHFKSLKYYAQSIEDPLKFLATNCSSYWDYKDGLCGGGATSYMGEKADPASRGVYYLSTY